MVAETSPPSSDAASLSTLAKPLISVVIPTFNRRDLVVAAVESVTRQTYRPLEIIIVDDASSDDTVTALESLRKKIDVPLQVHVHPTNRGAPAARNLGLMSARGAYVAFLDSDDRWAVDKLERQAALFAELPTEIGMIYTSTLARNEHGVATRHHRAVKHGDLSRDILNSNCVGITSTPLVRLDLLVAVGGFDEQLKICQDWDLWIRLCARTKVAAIDSPLVYYNDCDHDRISTNWRRRLKGHLVIRRLHLREWHRENTRARGTFAFIIGDALMRMGRRRLARPCFQSYARSRPGHPKHWLPLVVWLFVRTPEKWLALRRWQQKSQVTLPAFLRFGGA